DKFYSMLSNNDITDEQYNYAQHVWQLLNCQTLGDYHDYYLLTDAVLLADVFQSFRTMCLKYYGLDAAHYYSLPGLSWDACLKLTNEKLELLSDIDRYMYFERGGPWRCQYHTEPVWRG